MESKYYLFGASAEGIKRYNELKNHYNIVGFIDNDLNKQGKPILNTIRCISIDELNCNSDDFFVFVTSRYAFEISCQLEHMGIKNYAIYPNLEHFLQVDYYDKALCKKIDLCTLNLYKKLNSVDIESLEISDYNKRYLSEKTWPEIFKYSQIIYEILLRNPKAEYFLDYGGGTGLLSLLAIECGFNNVYYNDIYDMSVKDALSIACALGYDRKGYIEGDIEQVVEFCQQTGVKFDAIASYDVLEHIYDLESCFYAHMKILSGQYIICMGTGSNIYNKEIYNNLTVHHLKADYIDRDFVYGHKERDSLNAYFDIRYNIICNYKTECDFSLNNIECIGLAFILRGLIKTDIEKAVEEYVRNKERLLDADKMGCYKYNTCDPLTGNWCEHLINYDKLVDFLETIGYKTEIIFNDTVKETATVLYLILT